MKYRWKIRISLLILSAMIMMMGQSVFAADEYTYTVRLYPGNQGTLTGEGIEAPGAAKTNITDANGNIVRIEITGIAYNTRINIIASDAASEKDGRYYVKGVKRSGRDNLEEQPSFTVDCDKDYVIYYGVRGDTVKYTVNYVDENGNVLLAGETYYGNTGERQYVSARYIDGFRPDAYNKVMTLKENEAENVFHFVYTEAEIPADETGTAFATPGGQGTEGEGGEEAAADAGAAEAVPEGEDAVQVEDGQTPQELVDLDDEDTPLANQILDERPGTRIGYFPMYLAIALSALAVLALAALYLRNRQKNVSTVTEIMEEIHDTGDEE